MLSIMLFAKILSISPNKLESSKTNQTCQCREKFSSTSCFLNICQIKEYPMIFFQKSFLRYIRFISGYQHILCTVSRSIRCATQFERIGMVMSQCLWPKHFSQLETSFRSLASSTCSRRIHTWDLFRWAFQLLICYKNLDHTIDTYPFYVGSIPKKSKKMRLF